MVVYLPKKRGVISILAFLLLAMNSVHTSSLNALLQEDKIDLEVLAVVTYGEKDTLWKLAKKYYGDPPLWPIIAYTNRIYNVNAIPVGSTIYIPVKDAKKPTCRGSRTVVAIRCDKQ